MPGTEYRAGTPASPSGSQFPTSRTAEFSSGISGGGGTVHSVQQQAPKDYFPSSVLSPIQGTSNGQTPETFQQNRILDFYRS